MWNKTINWLLDPEIFIKKRCRFYKPYLLLPLCTQWLYSTKASVMFEAKTTSTKTILYRPLVMAEGQWTLDIETAWAELFKILTYHMKSAYGNSNSNNGAGIKDDHSSGSDMSTSISNSTDIAKTFPRRLEIVIRSEGSNIRRKSKLCLNSIR